MYLKKLFSPVNQGSVNYKAVDENTVTLTDEEKEVVLRKALIEKIGKINSENYLKALSYKPVYQIPAYDQLLDALKTELLETCRWEIDQWNIDAVEKLARYFSNDPDFADLGEGYSLKKGLLLFGPIGCGKTTLAKLLMHNPFNPFKIVSARKIADEFAEHGHSLINHYSVLQPVLAHDWFNHTHIGLCIDDLGTENSKKNYGNEVNVLAEVILNRYDNRDGIGKTHITTNISGEQIAEVYGARAASRMTEMFNIIEFPFDAPDRRK
jgi:DNA replication protein DnaC